MRVFPLGSTKFWAAGVFGLALTLGVAGCKSTPAPITDGAAAAADPSDPADVNLATPGAASAQPEQVLGQQSQAPPPQASGESYDQAYDQDQAAVDAGQQALYADQPPPPLPDYDQPELTEPGYIWTPGYWSYGPGGYYWVPGVWVAPPFVDALWTPGYWGFYSGRYQFHHGFWGTHIGFYGGINYGYGYTGSGYHGGYWQGNNFYYNQQVNRVNTSVVRNVYSHNVAVTNNTRVSYNGPRGVEARPSAADVAVYHGRVVPAMRVQTQQVQAASQNRQQFYTANQGRPAAPVVPERLAADRTPPAAIRPAPEVVRQPMPPVSTRPPVAGQPTAYPRGEQGSRPMEQPRPVQPVQPAPANPRDVRPVEQPQPRPVPESRPAPQPRPMPESRPAPQPQPRPVPEARPTPAPRPEAAPQPRPEARPAPAPRPQAAPPPHPQAAPPPRPAPRPPEHPPEPPKDEHPHP